MLIGHFGLAFASRRRDWLPSLAMSFIAVQLLDLIWPILVLGGIETFGIREGSIVLKPFEFTYYPYSHSLFMAVVWELVLAHGHFLVTTNKRTSLVIVPLVISHWLLDYITHKRDLQLSPFSPTRVGLGMRNHHTAQK